MPTKKAFPLVVDGRMTHSRVRRDKEGQYIEVLVFAGNTAEGDPVSDWRMPVLYDFETLAQTAVFQTKDQEERES